MCYVFMCADCSGMKLVPLLSDHSYYHQVPLLELLHPPSSPVQQTQEELSSLLCLHPRFVTGTNSRIPKRLDFLPDCMGIAASGCSSADSLLESIAQRHIKLQSSL